MEVIIRPDEAAAAELAARLIARAIIEKPSTVLGLATGRTMERVYARLARMRAEEGLDFSRVRTFNLDEYVGLAPGDPNSYRHYMNSHLFRRVNIDISNTHLPDGLAENLVEECRRYESLIADTSASTNRSRRCNRARARRPSRRARWPRMRRSFPRRPMSLGGALQWEWAPYSRAGAACSWRQGRGRPLSWPRRWRDP